MLKVKSDYRKHRYLRLMPAEEEVFTFIRENLYLYLNYQIMIISFCCNRRQVNILMHLSSQTIQKLMISENLYA
jgi:hypothetical protein